MVARAFGADGLEAAAMASVFTRGYRTFTVASALIVVVAALHLSGLATEAPNADWAAAEDAMEVASVEVGPFTVALLQVYQGAWIQISVLLALIAAVNLTLLALTPAKEAGHLVRTLSAIECVVFALLAGLFVYYQVPPPLISFVVLAVAFLGAALVSGRGGSQATKA